MSYDFDKKAFALIPDEIKNITQFTVSNGAEYVEQKVDNPPIYLASKKEDRTSNFIRNNSYGGYSCRFKIRSLYCTVCD